MLACFPASILNQKPSDLGILNRFKLGPSRSSILNGSSCNDMFPTWDEDYTMCNPMSLRAKIHLLFHLIVTAQVILLDLKY
jgi:hypothetical protein